MESLVLIFRVFSMLCGFLNSEKYNKIVWVTNKLQTYLDVFQFGLSLTPSGWLTALRMDSISIWV